MGIPLVMRIVVVLWNGIKDLTSRVCEILDFTKSFAMKELRNVISTQFLPCLVLLEMLNSL